MKFTLECECGEEYFGQVSFSIMHKCWDCGREHFIEVPKETHNSSYQKVKQ